MLMKIEQLVPNEKTCVKLKELGFPQNTHFYHYPDHDSHFIDLVENPKDFAFAAPTFQEIWEQLPYSIKEEGSHVFLVLDKTDDLLGYGYVDYLQKDVFEDNIAQAAAELWIQLKESEFI